MKLCKKCNQLKKDSEFHKRSCIASGLRSQCIECTKQARKKHCLSCGDLFVPNGRRSSRCGSCYPAFRQATSLFHSARHRAEEQGLEFNLTIKWIEQRLKYPCPKTGLSFDILHGGKDYSSRSPMCPSVDKINPSLGYTEDNVQVVSWWYNCSKQRFSDKEVLELCKAVVNQASL